MKTKAFSRERCTIRGSLWLATTLSVMFRNMLHDFGKCKLRMESVSLPPKKFINIRGDHMEPTPIQVFYFSLGP